MLVKDFSSLQDALTLASANAGYKALEKLLREVDGDVSCLPKAWGVLSLGHLGAMITLIHGRRRTLDLSIESFSTPACTDVYYNVYSIFFKFGKSTFTERRISCPENEMAQHQTSDEFFY